MKKAAIVLSQKFKRMLPSDFVIAADEGYLRALENKIRPDLVVGDMDSLGFVPKDIGVLTVQAEKDFSDGELAIREAILRNYFFIDIYGGWGGRPDHSLYNLHLLKLARDLGATAVLRGDDFDLYYLDGNLFLDVAAGDVLSIVPFSETVHIIKAKGLKYPADGAVLTKSDTLGLSNECTENSVFVSVKEGSALLYHKFG
ncbi:MAG: thiamine diphosphokinase [Clostridia bacterium]|nr:thiamine diphosphokinase [Clostridia bacterium]